MARTCGSRSTFKRSDALRALRTTQQAGLPVKGWQYAPDGTVTVLIGEPDPPSPASDGDQNPWDQVLNDPNPAGEDDTTVKRPPGRPSKASETQQAEVRHRREQGKSMQAIATETGLSFKTVRTIVDKSKSSEEDRASAASGNDTNPTVINDPNAQRPA